jgi:hypothetical protein
MLNVVLALEGGDVRASECLAAFVAEQIQSTEVISLAQRILAWRFLGYGKELGGDNLAAVLYGVSSCSKALEHDGFGAYMTGKALQMIGITQSPHKLARQAQFTLTANLPIARLRPVHGRIVVLFLVWVDG